MSYHVTVKFTKNELAALIEVLESQQSVLNLKAGSRLRGSLLAAAQRAHNKLVEASLESEEAAIKDAQS